MAIQSTSTTLPMQIPSLNVRKGELETGQGNWCQAGASGAGASPPKPRYIVKTKDFLPLAEFIAAYANPIIQVPIGLVNVLNRAIELGTEWEDSSRQSRWSDGQDTRIHVDATHSYSLGVLVGVREILKPRMPAKSPDKPPSQHAMESEALDSQELDEAEEITNPFAMLDLEESSRAFIDAPGVSLRHEIEAERVGSHEAETDQSQEEKCLAVHCLFQDICNIRSFIRTL